MHGLEDILGTAGFWLFAILFLFRGAIKELIVNAPAKQNEQISELKAQLAAVENRLAEMSTELIEVKEAQDFEKRFGTSSERIGLANNKRISSPTFVDSATTSGGGVKRLTPPQR